MDRVGTTQGTAGEGKLNDFVRGDLEEGSFGKELLCGLSTTKNLEQNWDLGVRAYLGFYFDMHTIAIRTVGWTNVLPFTVNLKVPKSNKMSKLMLMSAPSTTGRPGYSW